MSDNRIPLNYEVEEAVYYDETGNIDSGETIYRIKFEYEYESFSGYFWNRKSEIKKTSDYVKHNYYSDKVKTEFKSKKEAVAFIEDVLLVDNPRQEWSKKVVASYELET